MMKFPIYIYINEKSSKPPTSIYSILINGYDMMVTTVTIYWLYTVIVIVVKTIMSCESHPPVITMNIWVG